MKKYLAIILSAVFVLGFAASAFALHAEIPSETQAVVAAGETQITIGGEVRVRETYQNGPTTLYEGDGFPNRGRSWLDERVRLSVDAKVTANTEAFVQLESTNENVGTASQDYNVFGAYNVNTGATGLYNAGNDQHLSLSILQAWIQYSGAGLLGFPFGAKIGHMPLALGNSIFFDHTKFGDDAILFFAIPTKGLEIAVLDAKFHEGVGTLSQTTNDDADAYVGLFAYSSKEFGLSGDVTYVNDQRSYGTAAETGPAVVTPGPLAGAPTHFWNFGLRGNLDNIGGSGLNLMADGEVQTGKIDTTNIGLASNFDFQGYAVKAGATYKVAPVTLSLDWALGSGDDTTGDYKVKAFVTSLGADQHYTFVYEYLTMNACGQEFGGLCNTMYVKLGGNADFTKELSGLVNVFWLTADKAWLGVAGAGIGMPTPSKDIGWEVDAKLSYKLDRNLTYWVEGGYLFAGKFWAVMSPVSGIHDDAFGVRQGIQLNF